jgi:hypothetical protein
MYKERDIFTLFKQCTFFWKWERDEEEEEEAEEITQKI